jgi:hypothetical protein
MGFLFQIRLNDFDGFGCGTLQDSVPNFGASLMLFV